MRKRTTAHTPRATERFRVDEGTHSARDVSRWELEGADPSDISTSPEGEDLSSDCCGESSTLSSSSRPNRMKTLAAIWRRELSGAPGRSGGVRLGEDEAQGPFGISLRNDRSALQFGRKVGRSKAMDVSRKELETDTSRLSMKTSSRLVICKP